MSGFSFSLLGNGLGLFWKDYLEFDGDGGSEGLAFGSAESKEDLVNVVRSHCIIEHFKGNFNGHRRLSSDFLRDRLRESIHRDRDGGLFLR